MSHCSEILYEAEDLFDKNSTQYVLIKRIFGCYGVALTRMFEMVERLLGQNKALENNGERMRLAEQILQNSKLQQSQSAWLEGFKKPQEQMGGAVVALPQSARQQPRGVDPLEESLEPGTGILEDFQKYLSAGMASDIQLSLNADQMYHLESAQPRMSTNTFMNRIGAHLNTVRAEVDVRGRKQFRDELASILQEFQEYQKDVTQFINKQALEIPSVSNESDVRMVVESIMSERASWRNEAVGHLSRLIDRAKGRIVKMVERVEVMRKEVEKQLPSTRPAETQTEQQQPDALMEYFGEQTVLLHTTKRLNEQLE